MTVGCASGHNPSGPPPSYNIDSDLDQLSQQFNIAEDLKNYYANEKKVNESHDNADNTREISRNRFIAGRLVICDLQYLKWLRTVNTDKQSIDTAADVLATSLTLAITVTGGEAAKNILAASATALSGYRDAIDVNFYYQQSMRALIAAMNAERKKVRVNIHRGMQELIEEYSLEQAISDLYDYYQAGTFMGGVNSIVAASGAREKEADDDMKELRPPTKEEYDARKSLRAYRDALQAGRLDGQLKELYTTLNKLGFPNINDKNAAISILKAILRGEAKPSVNETKIVSALKDAGIQINNGQ